MHRWIRSCAAALVLGAVFLAGCDQPAPSIAPPDLVWPEPPATPRIKFLRTLSSPSDAGIQRGFFEKVVKFLEGAPEKQLTAPYGLEKDADGRLYVVDTVHKAVLVFDAQKSEVYWFPKEPLEGFENPVGLALGDDGRVYVSDTGTNVVHVFENHGKDYVRAVGKDVLRRPTGLAFDKASGNLLVADTLSSQLIVFETKKFQAVKFVGRESEGPKGFHFPTNIALAADGSVYVTDSLNFRVQALGPKFEFVRSFGQAGDAPGYFSRPKGIATDSDGNVYVVDALFDNVQIFDRQGQLLLAFGSPGSSPGQFWLPNEIFIDAQDRIYVSDSHNRRIQVFQYLKQGGREQ